MACFSCRKPAAVIVAWDAYRTPYCECCADSVIQQVEDDGYTVTTATVET